MKVSTEHLDLAAQWLESNEGEGFEKEACDAVAAMLRRQIAQRDERATARAVGRRHGLDPATAMRVIRRAQEVKRKNLRE